MNDRLPERLLLDRLPTPIGEALIVTDEAGYLRAFDWADCEAGMQRLLRLHYGSRRVEPGAAPAAIVQSVRRYFEGEVSALGDIEWRTGGTAFQQRVWRGLTTIPAGETLSYGALAARIHQPKSVRAVGHANGSNPISVVVPCHRVIGADGSLTGYGGGLPRKRWLLAHEGARLVDRAPVRGLAA